MKHPKTHIKLELKIEPINLGCSEMIANWNKPTFAQSSTLTTALVIESKLATKLLSSSNMFCPIN